MRHNHEEFPPRYIAGAGLVYQPLSSRHMYDARDPAWLDARLKDRSEERKQKRLKRRDPDLPVIDASKFTKPLVALAETIAYCVDREGPVKLPHSSIPSDTVAILRQLIHTYKLILFLNADERRDNDADYRYSYSFVILPLVRTMIDGFYNCTAMLDDPRRARVFRISGFYRIRESLQADEVRYSQDPGWREYLAAQRASYELNMRVQGFTDADLNDKTNEWPLLGKYLGQKPDTPHKQMLRKLTLGFWKEYSSISHASYDGLVNIFPFIAGDKLGAERRDDITDAAERFISMHMGRTAALLLCLLTEMQRFYKFDGDAEIDKRLAEIWVAMLPVYEVKELYTSRYRSLLRKPLT
jgi:hypothetical protein